MKLRPLCLGLVLVCAPLCLTLSPAAARANPVLTLDHGTVWQTQKDGEDTQGFIEIHNIGDAPDTLTRVNCTIADTTSLVDASGKPITAMTIAAGQSVILAGNAPHLLLQPARYKVSRNGILPCAFTFAESGDLIGYLNVVPAPKS